MNAASARHCDHAWPGRAVAVLCWLLLVLPASARANPGEVEALLRRLAESGCEFRRHGEWHDAGRASEHLRMKHRHILRSRPALTTEEFITLGASASSTTGQPYKVRCKGTPEQTGAAWMTGQLAAVRAAGLPERASPAPPADRPSQPSR
ncbi:DUF5329 family protein [Ramlibacter montanisoli]|uniref:DUF5329 family protein n=1 Tax=Ramlibacter montanisoli TaxID=2732512 RepID=A0A849K960_9BURK|nr:DUF5329 family protein [Ramlibacter montanisoli]NNU42026.1 DUF5329 family protein [Ramlibacter montanisoli]